MRSTLVVVSVLLLPCCGRGAASVDALPVELRADDGEPLVCSVRLEDPTVEVVDGALEEGAFAAAVAGPDGDLWIAYGDVGSDRLLVARDQDGAWAVEEVAPGAVDLGAWFGRSVAAAAGPDGSPCVAFFHQGVMDLRIACRDGRAGWTIEVVDGTPTAGKDVAMVAAEDLHLVYLDFLEGDLRYAIGAPGSWETRILDDVGYVGNDPSIALAEDGTAHIAYYSCGEVGMEGCSDGALRYGSLAEGKFTFETVDDAGDTGWYSSIALGVDGTVHIAYQSHSDGALRYAVGGAGAWSLETVDDGGSAGAFASLSLVEETVLIAHRDEEAGALELVARTGDGNWEVVEVDTGDAGGYASLLHVDGCAFACAYHTGVEGALELARWPAL